MCSMLHGYQGLRNNSLEEKTFLINIIEICYFKWLPTPREFTTINFPISEGGIDSSHMHK